MRTALVGARVFDGTTILSPRTVVIEGQRVASLEPDRRSPSDQVVDCTGGILAPGFVDVQANGGGGVLFTAAPTVATLHTMAAAHRRRGTTALVPTVISCAWETMVAAANAVAEARAQSVPTIVGIHFEGPYLNPARRGIHPESHVRPLDPEFTALASRQDLGVVVVTLAPECVPAGTIAALVSGGARVSLGHTMATREQTVAALDEGASGFTHLFNAMPPLASRAPGVIGAALSDPRGFRGLIVDGHHVDPVVLRIALRACGPEAMMLVSDAMATVGSTVKSFDLLGRRVSLEGGRLTTADDTLAGSELDMSQAVRNAVALMGLDEATALAMATRQPASFLGLAQEHGRLAAGAWANMVALDADLQVRHVWVHGVSDPTVGGRPVE